ncbi:apolipoprotein N-acyltransferase [Hellea balneolensis]|uniref:apolipoprotein N-acyltransferase n=1 Tax=Hellea balneolensis TaxID=287478 RepID=UPI000412D1FC|nr:apolipoprotein N-acyltransferase [Hellea balneolensis]
MSPASPPTRLLKTTGWGGRAIGLLLGALAVTGQAPLHFWPITLICLSVLLARLKWAAGAEKRIRAGFSAGFWFGFGYFMAGTYWIGSAFIARGPEFIPIMPPMILALGCVLAFFWGVAGAAFSALRVKGVTSLLAFISFFFLAEFARGHLFGGFPWNLPGYIFEGGKAMSQAASIAGVYGLTLYVFILASLLYLILFSEKRLEPLLVLIIAIGGVFSYGTLRIKHADVTYAEAVKLRLVQVRFSQKDKFDPDKSIDIVNQFLTASVSPGVDDVTHIIWPEGAINGLAIESEALLNAMGRELALETETPPVWLLNSLRHESRPHPKTGQVIDDYFNTSAAVTFNADGVPAIAAYNDKKHLVPFGEFIPGGKWMEMKNVPVISTSLLSISAAPEKYNAQFPGLPRLSPQICYEIIFSGFTPRPENETPPEWILNQSNDAWYGDSFGPLQHSNMATYRAIEEGLPIIRAASNGITGIINPYGVYEEKLSPKTSGIIDAKLPEPLKSTFFSRWVNLLLLLINLLTALWCTTVYGMRKLPFRINSST